MTPARTYGRMALTEIGSRWHITELEPHVAIRLKQLFPRVPKAAARDYFLPHDADTDADLVWFTSRYPFIMSPGDRATLEGGHLAFLDRVAEVERILLPGYEPPAFAGLQPGQVLRDYQAQAIEMTARVKGLLLGDECGLGKTFTGAGLCLDPARLPAAIVCEVHTQKQWEGVLKAFTTLRVHRIKKGSPENGKEVPAADVYLFRYTQLAGWVNLFEKMGFKTVVWDEPQALRTGLESAKGAAANVLASVAEYRLGLTATPIYNYGTEIYEVLRFIAPGVLGHHGDFLREWCNHNGRINDPRALGSYLRERQVYLRRTKADVDRELPPVNRIVDIVAYDEAEVRSVDDLARQLAIRATTGSFIERGSALRELDLRVRQATGVAKARSVARIVRVLVESGEPVVLFGWHRAVYDIWLEELGSLKPAMYTGSESPSQKEKSKQRFLAGETDLLIMSLRSAAGVDGLQHRCSWAVFGEFDWSPGIHHQCIERLDRDGQTRPVTALFLAADDGSDPPMMEVHGIKGSEARQIVDPLAGPERVHSDGNPLRSLVERYLSRRVTANELADVLEPPEVDQPVGAPPAAAENAPARTLFDLMESRT